ncbi:hypothetical protein SAMN05444714_1634 [Yoonia litorea]|uniref:Uncharacterized protein n=1 Tax=Yoonia litorea TaxID=1123755 RepID=A0A1I6MED4_9RHOB|nr:hypothetical protein SAMN05444714_1634 [Yoonia litorea]
MTKTVEEQAWAEKAKSDIAAERACLKCHKTFWSDGFGERICPRCKVSSVWRASIRDGIGNGQRRNGRRLS